MANVAANSVAVQPCMISLIVAGFYCDTISGLVFQHKINWAFPAQPKVFNQALRFGGIVLRWVLWNADEPAFAVVKEGVAARIAAFHFHLAPFIARLAFFPEPHG
jgi:hypothetical protein